MLERCDSQYHIFLAQTSPGQAPTSLQPLLARNKVGYWCPAGNATAVPGVVGFTAPTIAGNAPE